MGRLKSGMEERYQSFKTWVLDKLGDTWKEVDETRKDVTALKAQRALLDIDVNRANKAVNFLERKIEDLTAAVSLLNRGGTLILQRLDEQVTDLNKRFDAVNKHLQVEVKEVPEKVIPAHYQARDTFKSRGK